MLSTRQEHRFLQSPLAVAVVSFIAATTITIAWIAVGMVLVRS